MSEEKKTSTFTKLIQNAFKPTKSFENDTKSKEKSKEYRIAKHKPYWFYRNE